MRPMRAATVSAPVANSTPPDSARTRRRDIENAPTAATMLSNNPTAPANRETSPSRTPRVTSANPFHPGLYELVLRLARTHSCRYDGFAPRELVFTKDPAPAHRLIEHQALTGDAEPVDSLETRTSEMVLGRSDRNTVG
jgi:hypothetical protein